MPSITKRLSAFLKREGSGSKTSKRNEEELLEMLHKYDVMIILDDSGSMTGRLWSQAADALSIVAATAAKYDDDGIDVAFLNSSAVGKGLKSEYDVRQLLEVVKPGSRTPLGARLQAILNEYINQLKMDANTKPIDIIVITDGIPTDQANTMTEDVIVSAAVELEHMNVPWSQLGIQFVQIGADPGATAFLQSLDNNLKYKHDSDVRDMVDTVPYVAGEKLDIVHVLLGGINRRVDNRG